MGEQMDEVTPGWQWEQLEWGWGATAGWESPGMMGRAARGAVQGRQWEQLDLALGNSWMGEPSDGDGHGWVTLMGTRGCPGRHLIKLGPPRVRGAQFLPKHPQSSHGGFFAFQMNLMKLPLVSRSREAAAEWQERGH